jgi:hypothetical protein
VKNLIRHIWDLLKSESSQEQRFAWSYLQRWGSQKPKDDGWFAADRHWLAFAGEVYASRGLSCRESEKMARKILEALMKTSTLLEGPTH